MNKTFVVLLTALFLSPIFSLLSPAQVQADWLLDRSGTIVQIDGSILGDDDSVDEVENENEVENELEDDNDDSKNESMQRENESRREELKQQQEKSRELLKKQTEIRLKKQEKSGQKSQTEIRVEDGKSKLKQEIRDANGKLIQKREIEIKDGESLHIEQEDGETVEIDARQDGRLEMVKNRIKTRSELNLQVGEKNEISVTLPNGKTKEIALPDKALERLVANGVIESTEGGEESQYELIAGKNGDPAYEVEGTVEKKLFGLFKLKFAQKMEVAAAGSDDGSVEAGDVVETESRETGWRRFFERFSI